ncbi:hypothetical protein E1298_07475 [Actinomadura rubrisoli]|uniref:Uncharacterized protein n=1 Tax=Actinomadura rubrisoli TaxID=2530368 RepID=A0A4R5CAM3_9ACTN|nr:hypothetical protein E1298_07475 [Actinomadura rubrisoli]
MHDRRHPLPPRRRGHPRRRRRRRSAHPRRAVPPVGQRRRRRRSRALRPVLLRLPTPSRTAPPRRPNGPGTPSRRAWGRTRPAACRRPT